MLHVADPRAEGGCALRAPSRASSRASSLGAACRGRPCSSCSTACSLASGRLPPGLPAVPRGRGGGRNAPAAHQQLRNLSQSRMTVKLRGDDARAAPRALATELELHGDLEGRNGRWRQKRAAEDIALLEAQKATEAEEDRQREQRREERRAERKEWNQQCRETEREWIEAQMREHQAERDRAARHEAELERERQREEALESKRRFLRMPRPCSACAGTGKCPECKGAGAVTATYLSSRVSEDGGGHFHGRDVRGCQACGGVRGAEAALPRLSGACQGGSGRCPQCCGEGCTRRCEAEVEAAMRASGPPAGAPCHATAAGAGGLLRT